MRFLDPGTPASASHAIREAFERHHGRRASVIGWAPGRVNLIGEHTDYNAGLCLPMALPHSTYVAVAPRADDQVHIISEQQPTAWVGTLDTTGPGHLAGWPTYVAGVIWALRSKAVCLPGLDVVVDSRIPMGAGLSSSAAVACATALALTGIAGLDLTDDLRTRCIRACIRAETEVAGAPTGGMDQTIALRAVREHALLLDFDPTAPTPQRSIPLDLTGHGLELLIIDTRVTHALGDGGYRSRREDCEVAAAELGLTSLRQAATEDLDRIQVERRRRRARHVVSENERVHAVVEALENDDFRALGGPFAASHASLRDDFEVSCSELDLAVSAATHHGALAARMTGGGFGGSAIAIMPGGSSRRIGERIERSFLEAGHRKPQFLVAQAAPAGGRSPD